MTDGTTEQGQDPAELSAADEQLLHELTERARAGGLKLTGEGGLLGKLTKMVVEGALEGEMDDHLGYGARRAPRGLPSRAQAGDWRGARRRLRAAARQAERPWMPMTGRAGPASRRPGRR
jgi:hypothetical protein